MFNNQLHKSINLVSKRYIRKPLYMKSWPNDWVPFHWSRPEQVPGYKDTGDLEGPKQVKPNELNSKYRNSSKINDLDDDHPLKKIFTLDHATNREKNNSFTSDLVKGYGLIHEVDFSNSREAKIIKLTIKLRGVLSQIEQVGPDTQRTSLLRTIANSMKQRRYKYLCQLKELHAERHRKIVDLLNIEHKDNLINVPVLEPFRKVQMRKLATDYAIKLKEKKVEEFINSLEEEKVNFQRDKEQTLKWIEEQEKKLAGPRPEINN